MEFKLSQYADDTTVILDGSDKSLEETMCTLENFKKMSGLKINVQKTSAVWIGASKNNDQQMCPHLNLDWKLNGTFDMLGVTFSTNLSDMINLNYQNSLESMKSLAIKLGRNVP